MSIYNDDKLNSRMADAHKLTGATEQKNNIAVDSFSTTQEQNKSTDNKIVAKENNSGNTNNSNSTQNTSRVTDKELLSMVNLSNLRLEFAKLKIGAKGERENTNHTIKSMLDQEVDSIKSDKDSTRAPVKRVMYDYDNETNLEDPQIPLYKSIEELKKYIGIIYEYFEKYKKDDKITGFVDEWEILYAADGYKLVTEYIDFLYGTTDYTYCLTSTYYNMLNALFDSDEEIASILKATQNNINLSGENNNNNNNNDNTTSSGKENSDGKINMKEDDYFDRLLTFKLLPGNSLDIFSTSTGRSISVPQDITTKINDKIKEKLAELEKIKPKDWLFDTRKSIIERIHQKIAIEKSILFWNGVVTFVTGGIGGWGSTTVKEGAKATTKAATKEGTKTAGKSTTENIGKTVITDIDILKQTDILSKTAIDIKFEMVEETVGSSMKKGQTGVIYLANHKIRSHSGVSEKFVKSLKDSLNSGEDINNIINGMKNHKSNNRIFALKVKAVLEKTPTIPVIKTANTELALDGFKETIIQTSTTAFKETVKNTDNLFSQMVLNGMQDGLTIKEMGNDYFYKLLAEVLAPLIADIGNSMNETMKTVIVNTMNKDLKNDEKLQLFQKCTYFADITYIVYATYCHEVREFIKEIEGKVQLLTKDEEENLKITQLTTDFIKKIDNFHYENQIYAGFKEYPLNYFDFKVSIFKNEKKKSLVICFGDKGPFSNMKDDLKNNKYKDLFLLMEIVRHFVLEMEYIKDKDLRKYSVTVTGSRVGGELANIFHLATNYPTVVFSPQHQEFNSIVRTFNTTTLASLFNMKYKTDSEIMGEVLDTLWSTIQMEAIVGKAGQVSGMVLKSFLIKVELITGTAAANSALLATVVSSSLVSVIAVPILIAFVSYLYKLYRNDIDNRYYSYFYVQLCRIGIVECKRCSLIGVEKTIHNCKFTDKSQSLIHSANGARIGGVILEPAGGAIGALIGPDIHDDNKKVKEIDKSLEEKKNKEENKEKKEIIENAISLKEPPLVDKEKIKKLLYEPVELFPEYLQKERKSKNMPSDKINVLSDIFLNILTEYYVLNHNVKNIYKIFEKHNVKVENERPYGNGGIYAVEKIFDETDKNGSKKYKILEFVKSCDNKLYDTTKNYIISDHSSHLDVTIYKIVYIYLEKENEKYVLKKYYYHTCRLYSMMINEVIVLGEEKPDNSLGGLKTIFLQMIGFISDIQHLQNTLKQEDRDYLVYSYGFPDDSNSKKMIPYAKDHFLSTRERGLMREDIDVLIDKETNIIHDNYANSLDNEKLKELHNKDYYIFNSEFIFFPFIDDNGMIADKNLFRNLKEKPKQNVTKQIKNEHEMEQQGEFPTGNVSKYFKWSDTTVTNTGLKNTPTTATQIRNIKYSAQELDKFKEALGLNFHVNSWFRSEAVNSHPSVKGANNSAHKRGLAIDVKVPGMAGAQLLALAKKTGIPHRKLIPYPTFVHFEFNEPNTNFNEAVLFKADNSSVNSYENSQTNQELLDDFYSYDGQ